MATWRIYDCLNGVLAFDLRDLLDVLSPRSLEASWTVSPVRLVDAKLGPFDEFMVTGPGGDRLEHLCSSGSPASGTLLSEVAHETVQVIWGQFVATIPGQLGAWITIRAIDSSFYEVTTSDDTVLGAIRSAYKDVRAAPGPAISTPIEQHPGESA